MTSLGAAHTYLRVADIDTATQQAVQLGATLILEPMELGGWGKIAIYVLAGNQQGIWQVP